MKYLFLIDGAAGDAKKAIIQTVNNSTLPLLSQSELIYKESTRDRRGQFDDIKSQKAEDGQCNYTPSEICERYNAFKRGQRDIIDQYYCYQYPVELDIETTYGQEYYSIKKTEIDELFARDDIQYGFLIVRNQDIIQSIVNDYRDKLIVVPIYVHTDLAYIEQKSYKTQEEKDIAMSKARKVFSDYLDAKVLSDGHYEEVLLFSANHKTDKDSISTTMYEFAKKSMKDQIVKMLKERESISTDNGFIIMPFDDTRTYKDIRAAICDLAEEVVAPFGKQIDIDRADGKLYNRNSAIIQNIYDGISQASIVIVDLSNNKPNCYYELGYARALHKHVILISNKGTKLEFDEIGNNCYFYDIEDKNYDIKLQKHILEQMCSKGFFNKKR